MTERTHRRNVLAAALFSATLATVVYGQARAYGSELPTLSTVPAGAAEAPELTPTVTSSIRIERAPDGAETVSVSAPAPVVPPSVSAPQTVAEEGEGLRFVPLAEAGPECFATVAAYNEAWWAAGVAPVNPCFVVYEPNGQAQPDELEEN